MLKKQATNQLKQSTDQLKQRIEEMVSRTDELIKATGMPANAGGIPPENVLNNLTEECADHIFWKNFQKAAPMLFCALMEDNNAIKSVRDLSFMDELMKVK